MNKNKNIWNDNRGVSSVIGFVLVFGVIVAFSSLAFGFIAPDLAIQSEVSSNIETHEDMSKVASLIDTASEQERPVRDTIRTGTQYSAFQSASPAVLEMYYQVSTTSKDSKFKIENIESQDSAFYDNKGGDNIEYTTDRLELNPIGTNPHNSPVGLEYGLPYFNAGNGVTGHQTIIRDDIITIQLIKSESISKTLHGDSTVVIEADEYRKTTMTSNEDTSLVFYSVLPVEAWETALSEEYTDGNVENISSENIDDELNRITVDLKSDVEYDVYITEASIELD